MTKKRVVYSLLLLASVSLLASVVLVRYNASRLSPWEIISKKPLVTLCSNKAFQEVRVPFTLQRAGWMRGGWIMVPATVSGKRVECLLDTGMWQAFNWETSVPLHGRRVGLSYPDQGTYVGSRPRFAEWMVLPDIALGGYHLRECPALAHAPDSSDDPGLAVPTLGCAAFADVVLTLDYRRQEIIIRSADYDMTQDRVELSRYPRHCVVGLTWSESERSLWSEKGGVTTIGKPAFAGSVAGHPVQIAVDTGLVGVRLGLTSKPLIQALIREGHTPYPFRPCRQCRRLAMLSSATWSAGNIINNDPLLPLPGFYAKDEAVVGAEFLTDYRVTIDFPRKKLLLAWDPLKTAAR